MDHISIASQSQDPVHVQSKIDDFFGRFKIATLMHRCGMRKQHGHRISMGLWGEQRKPAPRNNAPPLQHVADDGEDSFSNPGE